MRAGIDKQAVPAYFDALWRNWSKLGQNGDFDLQIPNLGGAQRGKTQVVKGRALRAVDDVFTQRFAGFYHTDTAAQFSRDMYREEKAATQRKTRRLRAGDSCGAVGQCADDCGASQSQHGASLFGGETVVRTGRHPRTSRELPSSAASCAA